jgi:purine-binding chemotaxis protein CheW
MGQNYLIFYLESEFYALPINQVEEIIQQKKTTPLHQTGKALKGVISIRGKVVPIFDLRLKFGLGEMETSDRSVFIIMSLVLDNENFSFGVAVDGVENVVSIPEENIQKVPQIGKHLRKSVTGIAQAEDKMILLLDFNSIFASEEVIDIETVQRFKKEETHV